MYVTVDKVATKLPVASETIIAPFVIEFKIKTSIIEVEEHPKEKAKPKRGLRRVNIKNRGIAMRTAYLIHGDTANVSGGGTVVYRFGS